MFASPDLVAKINAIRDALTWAAKAKVIWENQADGGRVREANQVWGELKVLRVAQIGPDEVRNADNGDQTSPRSEYLCSQNEVRIQVKMRSRSQEHRDSAWHAAVTMSKRVNSPFSREKWLNAAGVSVIELAEVLDLPEGLKHDNRIEDVAIAEIVFGMALTEYDAAFNGTWIEHVEVTSNLKNHGGVSLDAALQLDKEVMP